MTVKDIMQTSVFWVSQDTSIKEAARTIFSTGISGLPVLQNKKVVGILAEEDILSHMHPSTKLMDVPVSKIMNRKVVTVTAGTSLAEARKMMLGHKFSRLPVVDKKGNMVGAISQGDVLRYVVDAELPTLEQNQYASFVRENYDQLIDWKKRFDLEFPTLFRVFARNNVKKVLDLGFWTGKYTIELAKEGVVTVGVDHNSILVLDANKKRTKLPANIKKKVTFKLTDYKDLEKDLPGESFDAVVCVGNALSYVPADSLSVFKSVHKLLKKDGVFILQLLNLQRVLEQKKRFLYFKIKKSDSAHGKEELFIEYYDKHGEHTLTQNIINFVYDESRWLYKGINSINIKYIKKEDVEKMLEAAGFKDINITGNKSEEGEHYGQMSLVKPFDPVTSDWMTVIAHM